MTWLFQLLFWIPLVFSSLVILWLFYLKIKDKLTTKATKWSFILVALVYFLDVATKIIYLYVKLRGDEFGKYLLPGKSTYFYNVIWELSSPYLLALAVGILFVLIFLLFRRIFRAELYEKAELYVLLLTVFVVGITNLLVLVVGSFAVMLLFLLGLSLKSKKMQPAARLSMSPFLLITAFVILILNNFDFYQNLLQTLHMLS